MTTGSPRARLRAARAVLRAARPDATGSRAYAGYLAVLLGALYAPLAWGTVAAAGRAIVPLPGGVDPRLALVPVAAALAFVAAAGARRLGVLGTSAPEVEFLLHGQFRPPAVLGRRAVRAVTVAAGSGAAVLAAVGTGAGVATGGAALVATAGVGAAAGGAVALASLAGQGAQRRTALLVTTLATAAGVVAVVVDQVPPTPVVLTAALCCLAAVVLLGGPALDAVDPDALLARQSRWRQVGRSVLAGDQRGATRGMAQLAGQRPARRGGHLDVRRAGSRLVLARDLLGLRRSGFRTTVSCAAALAATFLLVTATPGSEAAVLGALALYACTGSWVSGLAAHVDNADGSALTPHRARRIFGWHLQAPVLLAVAVTAASAGAALLLGAASPEVIGLGAALALLAVLVRAWQTSSPQLPPTLLTPVLTPAGDLSGVAVAAWFVRGWLVVAGVVLLAGRASDLTGGGGLLVVPVTVAVVLGLTARRTRSWV